MQRRHSITAMFLAASLLASPAAAQTPPETPASSQMPDFMTGYWLSCADGVRVSETWTGAGSGVLLGTGLTHNRRGVDFEFMRVARHEDGYAFFGSPRGAPAVPFKLVVSQPGRVVFENPAHDFPQRVTYERAGDVLTARVETTDGRKAMSWTYHKAPLDAACPAR